MENGINVTDKYVCFWGSIFSNWAPCRFITDDTRAWCSSEQYFMYLKACSFNDYETANEIYQSDNPEDAKALGRKVKNFSEEVWEKIKYETMHMAVYSKFSQNKKLKDELLSSEYEGKLFVEGSPFDKIWGVGLIWDCPEIADEKNWRGENLLGKVLDQVREELK